MSVACKNMNPDERLYNRIKAKFVEDVDPLILRFYLDLTTSDEERILDTYHKEGRIEAASLLLRLMRRHPGWIDQLKGALRNPQVGLDHIAKQTEDAQASLLLVADVEMTDSDEAEPMEVDEVCDVDGAGQMQSVAQPSILDILKQCIDNILKTNVSSHMYEDLFKHLLMALAQVVVSNVQYGCLEIFLKVKSLRSLYQLRTLYQGGALRDGISRIVLTSELQREIQHEAAKKGVRVKQLSLSVKISDMDFLECEDYLSQIDVPSPTGYHEAMAAPVDPFAEQDYPNLHTHLDRLPKTYQDFMKNVTDIAHDVSERETAMSWAKLPLCLMVKKGMDCLNKHFEMEMSLQTDLIKIGVNILAKSVAHKKKNVNVVTVSVKENELVYGKTEREFLDQLKSVPDMYKSLSLSTSLDELVTKGWLVKLKDEDEDGEKMRYFIPLALKRDYVVCYLLPTVLEDLELNLFLNTDDSLDKSVDLWLFHYASIILPYVACYVGLKTVFPKKALYFPNVALLLSSVHLSEETKEVRERFSLLTDQLDFRSFLKFQTSSEVDNHWRTWKTIASNLGCDHIKMVNKSNLDDAAFEGKISVIKDALQVSHGSKITLASREPVFDFKLALRSVALLDLLPSVMVETPAPVTKDDPRESSSTQPAATASAATSTTSSATKVANEAASTTDPPLAAYTKKTDGVQMRYRSVRSTSQDTSQRFSGSDKDEEGLQREGNLSLDSMKISGDYTLRTPSDWGFTLDLSTYSLSSQDVSLLCRFLPHFDHITKFQFDNSNLDTTLVKQIIKFLNPNIVQELSFVGCRINLSEGEIGLAKLRKIQHLNLEDTGLDDSGCPVLIKEIENMKNLKEFNIGCNQITYSGFSMLSATLLSKSSLSALRVHSNKLGVEGSVILAQLIYSLRHLEILNLWGCNFGDEGVENLSEMFPVHGKLKKLLIRDNNTSFISSHKLYKSLSSCHSMQFIDFNESNSLGSEVSEQVSASLLDMLKASSCWDHFSLWNCNIGQLTIFSNPDDFQSLSNVTYVCLQKNSLTDDSIKPLSQCVEVHFHYLQHLNLRENMMGDDGALALARALAGKQFLEDLWLDWNVFGHRGAEALIKSVRDLPRVQSVDLSFSFQLAPPEREALAHLIGDPERDGDLYRAARGQLMLTI